MNTYISLPVILLSTLAGAGSIGSNTLFGGSETANVVIGGISLTVATLNTVSSYFSWARRSESHRIAATTYAKVYRFILIELAMPRSERIQAKDMLKIVREQCDRLQETSPQIPDNIIEDFKRTFGSTTPDVKKPEITNGLDPIYVHPPDMDSPRHKMRKLAEEKILDSYVQGMNPVSKTSTSDHTLSKLQMSSLVHLPTVSEAGSNHT